jgi:hypothetical protein
MLLSKQGFVTFSLSLHFITYISRPSLIYATTHHYILPLLLLYVLGLNNPNTDILLRWKLSSVINKVSSDVDPYEHAVYL